MRRFAKEDMKKMSTNTDRNYENDVIDLQELFKTLWRGKYIIALAMVAFGFLGSYYSNSVAVPMYTSTSVVILDQRESDVANLGDVLGDLGGDTVTLNSEVEVIRSRGLMEKVIEELSLLSDSEFNPSLSLPSQLDMFMNKVKNVLGLEKEVPDLAPYDRREIITAVDILLEKLTVRLMPNTLVIRITVETTSGEKSAEIAQTIAETYVRNQIQVKFRATEDATVWLSNRVTELEAEVERTQAEVKAFVREPSLSVQTYWQHAKYSLRTCGSGWKRNAPLPKKKQRNWKHWKVYKTLKTLCAFSTTPHWKRYICV